MTENSCPWVGNDPLMQEYHDKEWGKPVFDDNVLFEFLILEGAQAGLSWKTVLHRREAYRHAYQGFNPALVAKFSQEDVERLLSDCAPQGIIKNRRKIECSISNAKLFRETQAEFGSFSTYFWAFTSGKQIVNNFTSPSEIPAETELSQKISHDLKKRGFKFVGSIIIYAYMQAVGMVNDHLTTCPCYKSLQEH
ncbi:MAG: DNA-3-methyladenine glycosylase I [Brevinema sp.]